MCYQHRMLEIDVLNDMSKINIDVLDKISMFYQSTMKQGWVPDALTKSAAFRVYAPPHKWTYDARPFPLELKNAFYRGIRFPSTEKIRAARNARQFINRMMRKPVAVLTMKARLIDEIKQFCTRDSKILTVYWPRTLTVKIRRVYFTQMFLRIRR